MSVGAMTDREIEEMGEALNAARDALKRVGDILAAKAWRGHLAVPMGTGHVAIVVSEKDARTVREMLG